MSGIVGHQCSVVELDGLNCLQRLVEVSFNTTLSRCSLCSLFIPLCAVFLAREERVFGRTAFLHCVA